MTSQEIKKAIKESEEIIAKELAQGKILFEGLHKVSPPPSAKLSAYYEKLRHYGQNLHTKKNLDGQLIEHPSIPQLEQYCRDNGVDFIDIEFPPCEDSLYRLQNREDEKPVSKRPALIWKRPPHFFKSESGERDFRLFDTIEPGDIKQGLLGDCWLMCSLAAVAEFPKLVKVYLIS